jgi:hypothetical protein
MLSKSNAKLGHIRNWSIPAIKTCPGRSKICESLCYAAGGFFRMANVKKTYAKNLRSSKGKTWADRLIKELKKTPGHEVIRIHVSGDFYDKEYIGKWIKIVKSCPEKTFYAYTRSWRVKALLPLLLKLAALPNIQMWWSVDQETGPGPVHGKIKQAYLSIDDQDVPQFAVDLVFREKTDTIAKKVGGAIVCPYEQGRDLGITCQTCKLCFKQALPKESA